jgi:hypothetical protein
MFKNLAWAYLPMYGTSEQAMFYELFRINVKSGILPKDHRLQMKITG